MQIGGRHFHRESAVKEEIAAATVQGFLVSDTTSFVSRYMASSKPRVLEIRPTPSNDSLAQLL